MPRTLESPTPVSVDEGLLHYINLKLLSLGQPISRATANSRLLQIAGPLLRNYHQKDQLLGNQLCPADARIQGFLDDYLKPVSSNGAPRLPSQTFVLDRPGLARELSIPAGEHSFTSPMLKSYRLPQGVLHNPKSDRRTTQGIFHIVEGGLPVPADKVQATIPAFAALLKAALSPPQDLMVVPFTANQPNPAHLWISLLLRPIVCPATGTDPQKSMETRFFAPASLVSNLDFVEGIFGNGGDPYLPRTTRRST
jgi:hypothetical protein